MNVNDKIRIEHILEAIQDIETFTLNCSRENFLKNRLIQSAVVRQFEIIGEASGFISEEIQFKYSNIPWRVIKNFRNILIHQYFGVDYNEVFSVIENELGSLKNEINKIILENL